MRPVIIIDANIPYIKGVFENTAEVRYLHSDRITRDNIADADALIIRTRTICDKSLLNGTNVQYIATATIGTDHIDTEYCQTHNIRWSNAPGCNAESVAQYVGSAMAYYSQKHCMSLRNKTIGIIGHGYVGHAVERMAQLLGMRILLNDPIRAEFEHDRYVSLNTIAEEADVITFHTPITKDGKYPTYRLADRCFFESLCKNPLIINAARGGIVDETELLAALDTGRISDCIIDCWLNEPDINRELVRSALISTPHIAGYSADGKHNATKQTIASVAGYFGLEPSEIQTIEPKQTIITDSDELPYRLLVSYNIEDDSFLLKDAPHNFEKLRNNYHIRRETVWITA